jgi:hypothetical protein
LLPHVVTGEWKGGWGGVGRGGGMIYCSALQASERYIKGVFSRSALPAIMDYGHSM